MSETLIVIKQLNASFQTREGLVQAVDGASLELKRGQIFGLIGETGSGKSVLGLSLVRLLPAQASVSGSILYKGKDLLKLSPKEMRQIRGREIALIPQNPASSLNPVMTLGSQLREAIRAYAGRAGNKQLNSQAAGLLHAMNMPDAEQQLRRYPFQLSGGMKQRVLAAMGLAGSPSMLIADEPTKGLDALIRVQVTEMLANMARRTGAALLLITHDLDAARVLCDEVGVMYAGQIIEQGPAKELFAQPMHPYTRGLIASMPSRGMIPIAGTAPSLTDMPAGCKFYERCSFAMLRCKAEQPDLYKAAHTDITNKAVDQVGGMAEGQQAAAQHTAILHTTTTAPYKTAPHTTVPHKVRCFLYA